MPALAWEPTPDHRRTWLTGSDGVRYYEPRRIDHLLEESLLTEHAARVRLKKMIDAAPFVTFPRSDKSIHYNS